MKLFHNGGYDQFFTFPSAAESAEENHNSRSAKGNKYLRRVLNQAVHARECDLSSKAALPDPQAQKKRARILARALRKLGYEVAITHINLATVQWLQPLIFRKIAENLVDFGRKFPLNPDFSTPYSSLN
jgi:hypothetical protein